ncbi:MAG: Ig-like domain-containing protein [Arcicella sp.]|nr:Ig-like domain-containing protein [Arcicella sp.]
MKKLLSMLFPAVFLFWGITSTARAQSGVHPVAAGKFDVRFTVKSVDCSVSPKTLTIAVQVRATSIVDTFLMGDANYRFRFKTTQLKLMGTAPTYAPSLVSQENYSAKAPSSDFNYGFQNLNGSGEGPTDGIVSLNTFYSGSNAGAKLVMPVWTTVACIKFTVVSGPSDCFDIVWDDDKTFPVTGMNEVYDLTNSPAFDYKQENVAAGGYFGNVSSCLSNYCSPILAENDINLTTIGTPVSGQVLTNDVGSGLIVTTTPIANPTNGSVVLNANGTYTYTPAAGYSGIDVFKYKVCDNLLPQKCDTATVTITILPAATLPGVNAPPIAQPDVTQTTVGVPVTGNVLANDFDPNPGQVLTVTTTPNVPPTNGTVSILPNGTYTYTPNPGFSGQDTFTYQVCDNGSPVACTTSTVTIDVTVDNAPATVNKKPVAGDDSGTTPKNTALTGVLSGNDTDPNAGQVLAYTTTPISAPTHGTVTITPTGGYTYTPTTGYLGPDVFTYKVCDNGTPVLCDTATVYLTVTGSPNALPVIVPPAVTPTTPEDPTTPLTVCYTYTDADAADTHTPSICGTNNGTTTIASTNPITKTVCLSYTPNPNFSGTDSICVKVCDNAGGCTTTKIPVIVTPVNDPPVVLPKSITMPEDSLAKTICLPIVDVDLPTDTHTAGLCTTPKAGSTATVLVDNITHQVCITYKPAPNFVGQDTICVKICDAAGLCTTVLIPVVVTPVNDPPVVTKTPQVVTEDSGVNPLCLPIADPDNNDTHTVTVCGAAKNGTATPTVNNVTHQVCLNYTPNPNFTGQDSVCVTICDAAGLCVNVTIPITVTPVPDPPVVVIVPIVMPEDSASKTVCMPITDADAGDLHAYTICGAPQNGTAVVAIDNATHTLCITYTPYTNFNGQDSICVKVCDLLGLCTSVTIPITVTPVNDKPMAINDVNVTPKATPVSGNVLTNDKDPDTGQTLTVTTTPVTPPANGTVVLNADGSYTYTPNPTFVGTDSFKYKVCDSGTPTLCDTATVVIEVFDPATTGGNRPPIALNDNVTTPEGTPITIPVKANDTDPDGNTLSNPTIIPGSGPTKGTVVVNPDGTVVYTPTPGATGTDSFKYKVCDNGIPSKCDTATVTVELSPIPNGPVNANIAPNAVDDSKQTPKGSPVSGSVATNDSDPNVGQVLTFTQTSTPTNGTVTNFNPTTGTYTYTPNPTFVGVDQFTYKVCDNGTPVLCSSATVYIEVTNVLTYPPVVVVPTVTPTIPEDGGVLTVCMPVTDVDAPDTHTATPCGALNGTVTATINNATTPHQVCFTYTPALNFTGIDSVCVKVCDSYGNCTTVTVPVKVTPVPDPPVVTPVPVVVPEDGTVTTCMPITDPDANDTHTISLCAAPKHGNASVAVNNNTTPHQLCITYTPLPNYFGNDTICVKVCDVNGLCTNVLVPVVVTPVNDPPIAKNDIIDTPEGTPVSGNVLTNDTDPDGNPLTASGPLAGTGPAKGTVVINPDGTFTYTPTAGATGTDTFKYQVCDNETPSLCDTAMVTVTLTKPLTPGTNLAPIANPDVTSTLKDKPVTINVLANDGDPEGTPLKNPTIVTPPTKGTVVVNPDGTITYTPNPETTGDDTFTYQVCDSGTPVACSTTTVTVSVNEPNNVVKNDPPVATDDAKLVNKNSTVTSTVAPNDSDPNVGQTLTFANTTLPANGTLQFFPNGTFTYIPNAGFVGADSFVYKACDNGTPSYCSTATVYLTIVDPTVPVPATTLPVALDDNSTTPKATPVIIAVKTNDTYVGGTLGLPTTISTPANGTVVTNANGTMTYTPNPTFVGIDSYKYKVCDAVVLTKCDTAVVTITVKDPTPAVVNNPPTPIDDAKITLKGTSVSGTVAANDSDPDAGQILSFTKLTNPANGTIVFNAATGAYTYTPNATFVGTDMFTYKVCDNGNPVLCANATAYITILDQPCVTFDLKVILEGPYSSGTGLMSTVLNQRGLLPGQTPVGTYATPTAGGQPYNVLPFSYAGSETMTAYPATVVDWVLVSLRTDSTKASKVFSVAGLLHNDGRITFVNPCFTLPSGSYYVVVEHRNHMGVMSHVKVPVSAAKITYDFTAQQSYQLTNPPSFGQRQIGTKFTMYAADGSKATINDNYDINFKDSQLWKTLSGNFDIYLLSDFNLDADSNFMDNSLWKTNSGRYSGVLH